jgi:hypothetical protein
MLVWLFLPFQKNKRDTYDHCQVQVQSIDNIIAKSIMWCLFLFVSTLNPIFWCYDQNDQYGDEQGSNHLHAIKVVDLEAPKLWSKLSDHS